MKDTASLTVIGMDIAKNVFQIHCVCPETGEIERFKLKRDKVVHFFAQRPPCLVGMEACGGAHYWGRTLVALGHQVKLIPAFMVKPFVTRDKTDARDAEAIWVAVQQRHIRAVPIKSEEQQACLALHRIRTQLMKLRIMQTNAIRGMLNEFGVVLPEGHQKLLQKIPTVLENETNALPKLLVESLREQLNRVNQLQSDIHQIDRRLLQLIKDDDAMQLVQTVPGVGPLTATALVATATDVSGFSSGRQFAAWLGLTPRQTGTGGKIRQLGISKRGDAYVRTLLIHGARAIIARSQRSTWVLGLLARRPYTVAVVALANKLARVAWAVLTKGERFNSKLWMSAEAVAV